MTLPNGADGITQGPLQALTSVVGASGGIPALQTLDQPAAENMLKQLMVLDNDKINGPLGLIYSGLRAGISLPLALAEAIAKQLLGLDPSTVFLSVEHVLSAIANWAGVLLPDQIKEPIRALVNILVTALDLIPIFGPPAGDLVEYLAGIFGLLNDNTTTAQDTGENAQTTADSALALSALNSAQINSTGGKITDTFDRAASASLGANYDQSYMPGGVGSLGTNGSNDAEWARSGAFHSWGLARDVTPLTTNIQASSIVIATDIPFYSTGDSPEEWILLRCNAAKTEYVMGKVGAGYAEIGYVIASTYTRLGARLEGLATTSGLWDGYAGTLGDDYEFVLLQGGNEVMRRTDAAHASQMDASHLFTGFGQYTGGEISFFFSVQGQPPNIQAHTAIDRTATA